MRRLGLAPGRPGRPHRRHRPEPPARPQHRGRPDRGSRPRDRLRQGPRARRDRHPRSRRPTRTPRPIETIRSTLVGAGYFEAVTFSFVSDALAGDFVPPEARRRALPLPRADAAVRKADAHLRPSILPGLLEAVRRNETVGTPDAKLFEIGSTFWHDDGRQRRRAPAARPRRQRRPARRPRRRRSPPRNASTPTAPSASSPTPAPASATPPAAGSSGAARPIGHLGKIDRAVADKLSLRDLPAAAELELPPLLAGAQARAAAPPAAEVPRRPARPVARSSTSRRATSGSSRSSAR